MFPANAHFGAMMAEYAQRTQRLERALEVALDVLQTVVTKLDQRFGAEFLGPEVHKLVQLPPEGELLAVLEQIDAAVKAGQNAAAARQIRAEFDINWSEAHAVVGNWREIPRARRLSWLKLVRFVRAIHGETTQKGVDGE